MVAISIQLSSIKKQLKLERKVENIPEQQNKIKKLL